MKHAIPVMLGQGGGALVNVASILGHAGFAGAPAYVAAKHGVVTAHTPRDHEFTDRAAVDAFADAFAERLVAAEAGKPAPVR